MTTSRSSARQTAGDCDTIIGTLTAFLGAIAAISLLVGGIGIMNIMLVSVTERTREIGIRKAIGALRRDILAQFLLESMLVSVLGGLIRHLAGLAHGDHGQRSLGIDLVGRRRDGAAGGRLRRRRRPDLRHLSGLAGGQSAAD